MGRKCMWQISHSQVRDSSQERRQHEQLLVSRNSHQEESKLTFGSLDKWYLREHQWGGCAERNQAVNVAAGAEGVQRHCWRLEWGSQTRYSSCDNTWQDMAPCLMWPPLVHQSLRTRLNDSGRTTDALCGLQVMLRAPALTGTGDDSDHSAATVELLSQEDTRQGSKEEEAWSLNRIFVKILQGQGCKSYIAQKEGCPETTLEQSEDRVCFDIGSRSLWLPETRIFVLYLQTFSWRIGTKPHTEGEDKHLSWPHHITEMWYSLLHTTEALLCKSDLLFPGACCLSATKVITEEVLWLFQPSDCYLFLFICGWFSWGRPWVDPVWLWV